MKYAFTVMSLMAWKGNIYGQKIVVHQKLVWYGYYNSLSLNEKWKLKSELQERHFIKPTAQHQLVLRSNLERKIVNNFCGSIGMTLFLQSSNNPYAHNRSMIPELRPDIGFEVKQQYHFVTINHRYKMEARFFYNPQNNELTRGYLFSNFRFRYQIGFDIAVKKKWSIKIKNELMINIGNKIVTNTFDQNRIYLGLYYQLGKKTAIETGYMNWYQQQASGSNFYNRNIIRFSFFHKI